MSQENKLEVWHITNLDDRPLGDRDKRYPVDSVAEARRLIKAVADAQLFCDCVESNMFGLTIFKNGEWEEWEDGSGYTITESDENVADACAS